MEQQPTAPYDIIEGYPDLSAAQTTLDPGFTEIYHLFVLVPGTVDAVNSQQLDYDIYSLPWGDEVPRGKDRTDTNGHVIKGNDHLKTANEHYWEGYPRFHQDVEAFVQQAAGLGNGALLLDRIRWSGDNNIDERKRAGQHLLEVLVTGNGPEHCWPDKDVWQGRPVYLHLIGHSHGGNVINEFTRCAKDCAEWPTQWQIKTVMYLSTPFFENLHAIDAHRFHTQCQILSLYNPFDMTQRVIADYNALQLPIIQAFQDAGIIDSQQPFYQELLDALRDLDGLDERLQAEPGLWDNEAGEWQQGAGARFWTTWASALADNNTFDKGLNAIQQWLDDHKKDYPEILTGPVMVLVNGLIKYITRWRQTAHQRFSERLKNRNSVADVSQSILADHPNQPLPTHPVSPFDRNAFFVDLAQADLVRLLAWLLGAPDITPEQAKNTDVKVLQALYQNASFQNSPLLRGLDSLLYHRIEVMSDTFSYASPTRQNLRQLKGYRIENISVAKFDSYYRPSEPERMARFNRFVGDLESLQRNYFELSNPDSETGQQLRQDFVLRMLANLVPSSWIYQIKAIDDKVAIGAAILNALTLSGSDSATITQTLIAARDVYGAAGKGWLGWVGDQQSNRQVAGWDIEYLTPVMHDLINRLHGHYCALEDSHDLLQTLAQSLLPKDSNGQSAGSHHSHPPGSEATVADLQALVEAQHHPELTQIFDQFVHDVVEPDFRATRPGNDYRDWLYQQVDLSWVKLADVIKQLPQTPQAVNPKLYQEFPARRGTLMYFAFVSHSISRLKLYHGHHIRQRLWQSCAEIKPQFVRQVQLTAEETLALKQRQYDQAVARRQG